MLLFCVVMKMFFHIFAALAMKGIDYEYKAVNLLKSEQVCVMSTSGIYLRQWVGMILRCINFIPL